MVELVLVEQDNTGDLAANGNDPTERGEKAEARGSGLLGSRCCESLVTSAAGLLSVMTRFPDIDAFAGRHQIGRPTRPAQRH